MDIIYPSILATNAIILIGVFVYLMRSRKSALTRIATEQNMQVNLRRELQVVNANIQTHKRETDLLQAIMDLPEQALLVFAVDQNNTPLPFSMVTPAACKLLAYSDETLKALTPENIELVPGPGSRNDARDVDHMQLDNNKRMAAESNFTHKWICQQIQATREGRTTSRETTLITKDQHLIPVILNTYCIPQPQGDLFVYALHDMRATQERDQQLRQAEQAYDELYQSARIGIASYDEEHVLQNANPACLRMLGTPTVDELRALDLFQSDLIPAAIQTTLKRGDNAQGEIMLDFDYLITNNRFVTRRRGKAFFELFYFNLGRDAEHQHRGHLVQVRDRSELRQTASALQLRETQLLQARKMEAIGTMTGGIAHDFNNILTPILGYAEIGLDYCTDSPVLKEYVGEIQTATLRAKDLVNQILMYARQSKDDQYRIHLAPILKEVAKQQNEVLGPDVAVTCKIRTKTDMALTNPTQMHQILTNLCTNAGYAMQQTGGNLDIQLSGFNLGWRHRSEFPQLQKGTYLRISVRDSGPGISEEIRDKIFDPFFSTKPRGEGTGMGLAVVKNIVDAAGGAIALDSKEGEGSTFHIALPLVEEQQEAEATTWKPNPASGGSIVFVDDEPAIARMATALLASLGYTARVFTDPNKALQAVRDHAGKIDCLITDQVMPGQTGLELAEQVYSVVPELPMILCTGFPAKLDLALARQIGIRGILLKPVTRRELGQALEHVLQGENLFEAYLQEQSSRHPPEADKHDQQDEHPPTSGNP